MNRAAKILGYLTIILLFFSLLTCFYFTFYVQNFELYSWDEATETYIPVAEVIEEPYE